jgi:hypothetical protein
MELPIAIQLRRIFLHTEYQKQGSGWFAKTMPVTIAKEKPFVLNWATVSEAVPSPKGGCVLHFKTVAREPTVKESMHGAESPNRPPVHVAESQAEIVKLVNQTLKEILSPKP